MSIRSLFLFIVFGFLFSCGQAGLLSSDVNVLMHSTSPVFRYSILHFAGRENSVCRKGIPENYYPPWDEEEDAAEGAEQSRPAGDDGSRRRDVVYVPVKDYWFKFAPVIENNSRFYLVITELNVRIFRGNEELKETNFSDGWCETSPLYFFEPKGGGHERSFIRFGDTERRFHKGNLVFFVDDLQIDQEGAAETGGLSSRSFPALRLPELRMSWQMVGYFAQADGDRVGGFQKTGSFSVKPSSF